MESLWKVYAKKADFCKIAEKYNIDPVIARIIRNRDVITDEEIRLYLEGSRADFHDGLLMKDMSRAIQIISDKIKNKAGIRIIGDYDVDGISSIYILMEGLKAAGADVDYVVPHRINDGYGINESLIKDAFDAGIDTIITCDNGIAALEQIKYARELGMTVIITDHHDIRFKEDGNGNIVYEIPDANAVVNPKQTDCPYPFKGLCGAAVAYKLVECLLKSMLKEENFSCIGIKKENYSDFMDNLLSVAAVATVGDVMVLQGENRVIVKEGLRLLNNTNNQGLRSLMELNGIGRGGLSAYHIGFILGPCLNASGRLDSAKRSIELLMSKSKPEADRLAGDLKAFNDERKNLTNNQLDVAIDMVDNTELQNDKVLVVFLPDCHESIAGIIAGRLREKYYKPTIVVTHAEDGLKGSGRSISSYNMFEHLLGVRDLMTKFGGHPMAAGVSMQPDKLDEFRRRLNGQSGLTENDLTPVEMIDVPMPIEYITESIVDQLSLLEPFGNGNEKPLFADRNLIISHISVIGKNKNNLKMKLTNSNGYTIEALRFSAQEAEIREWKQGDMVSVLYYPSVNEYNGRRSLQIVVKEMRKKN